MHVWFYSHLKSNDVLLDKQLWFELNNFIKHSILQLVNDTSSSFKKENKDTRHILIYLK